MKVISTRQERDIYSTRCYLSAADDRRQCGPGCDKGILDTVIPWWQLSKDGGDGGTVRAASSDGCVLLQRQWKQWWRHAALMFQQCCDDGEDVRRCVARWCCVGKGCVTCL